MAIPWDQVKEALKGAVHQKSEGRKKIREQKKQIARMQDLYKKVHTVEQVTLPIMNAFAWDLLDKYFNPFENLDFTKSEDLGVFVYVIENQLDEGLIDISKEDLRILGIHRLMQIPQHCYSQYMQCIEEILTMIKKKASDQMTDLMSMLQKFQDGDPSASLSPKDLAKTQKNSI